MPKIEIYEEKKQEEEPTRLRLVEDDITIELIAVDAKGEKVRGGSLLVIPKDLSTIVKCRAVNPDLGFKLTPRGELDIV